MSTAASADVSDGVVPGDVDSPAEAANETPSTTVAARSTSASSAPPSSPELIPLQGINMSRNTALNMARWMDVDTCAYFKLQLREGVARDQLTGSSTPQIDPRVSNSIGARIIVNKAAVICGMATTQVATGTGIDVLYDLWGQMRKLSTRIVDAVKAKQVQRGPNTVAELEAVVAVFAQRPVEDFVPEMAMYDSGRRATGEGTRSGRRAEEQPTSDKRRLSIVERKAAALRCLRSTPVVSAAFAQAAAIYVALVVYALLPLPLTLQRATTKEAWERRNRMAIQVRKNRTVVAMTWVLLYSYMLRYASFDAYLLLLSAGVAVTCYALWHQHRIAYLLARQAARRRVNKLSDWFSFTVRQQRGASGSAPGKGANHQMPDAGADSLDAAVADDKGTPRVPSGQPGNSFDGDGDATDDPMAIEAWFDAVLNESDLGTGLDEEVRTA